MKKENRITVLFVDNTFSFRGAFNSLSYLVKELSIIGFDPVVVSGQQKEFLEENIGSIAHYSFLFKLPWIHNRIYKQLTDSRIDTHQYSKSIVKIFWFFYWQILIPAKKAIVLYKIGKKHNVQLVHLNNFFSVQLSGIICAKLFRVPCVSHSRGFGDNAGLSNTLPVL